MWSCFFHFPYYSQNLLGIYYDLTLHCTRTKISNLISWEMSSFPVLYVIVMSHITCIAHLRTQSLPSPFTTAYVLLIQKTFCCIFKHLNVCNLQNVKPKPHVSPFCINVVITLMEPKIRYKANVKNIKCDIYGFPYPFLFRREKKCFDLSGFIVV